MHKTDSHWEGGAIPSQDLIARVGQLLGEMTTAGVLEAGEGLRSSAEGVRVRFEAGARTITPGPFEGGQELPGGFTILRSASLDAAVEWATRAAEILGDIEIDIRPVTEPWDIGMCPAPDNLPTRRYMVLHKATAASEGGEAPSAEARVRLSKLIEDTVRSGAHIVTEMMKPSRRGRRYKNSNTGLTYFDGPMVETKEMIGGYVVVTADSLEEACAWAEKYLGTVQTNEVDVRELE